MTELPAPVKTFAAVCAFLVLSYAISVYAAPRTGTEDLGGWPFEAPGGYGRDPAPLPEWRRERWSTGEAAAAGPDRGGRVATASVTPVSARTAAAEVDSAAGKPRDAGDGAIGAGTEAGAGAAPPVATAVPPATEPPAREPDRPVPGGRKGGRHEPRPGHRRDRQGGRWSNGPGSQAGPGGCDADRSAGAQGRGRSAVRSASSAKPVSSAHGRRR